jgi:hypothetical protein
MPSAPPANPRASNIAVFSSTPQVPPSWPTTRTLDVISCPHGSWSAYSALQNMPGPPGPPPIAITSTALRNLWAVTGDCGCQLAGAPGSVTATVTIQPAIGIPSDASVALSQAASGSLPNGFTTDGFGRLSTTQAGMSSITATFSMDRSVANGAAGGIAALRLPDASVPTLTAPSVTTVGLVDNTNAQATATISYAAQLAANTSFELNFWNGSGFAQDLLGGSMTVTLVPLSAVADTLSVEKLDANSRAWLAAGGCHWIDVVSVGSALIVEAGCPAGWSGRREEFGAGGTAQPLVEDLVREHGARSGCVVSDGVGASYPRGFFGWFVAGSQARLGQLAEQGVLS